MRVERDRRGDSGLTLVEMLVVIGVIGIVASLMMGSYQQVKRSAWRSRANQQVHAVKVALNVYLQNERDWPEYFKENSNLEMDEHVCGILQNANLLDVTTWNNYSTTTRSGQINQQSPDRFGFLDPWGRAIMRRNRNASEADVRQHRIQFRVDRDMDGYVDGGEGAPRGRRVRGSVIVWSRGPDGQDDFQSTNPKARNRYPYDDVLGWTLSGD